MIAYFVHHLSPFLIQFSNGFGIRYYGLSYALGFFFLWLGMRWQRKHGLLELSTRQIDDLVFWIALGGVMIGGRLGYCLLYDFFHTVREPWFVFQIWKGGMSSHGGILGVLIVLFWASRKWKVPFFHIADAAVWLAPVGIFFGRLANFVNGELWGRPTTLPWGVIFPDAPMINGQAVPRHPSQLYEALLEGVVLFGILTYLRFRKKSAGSVSIGFLFSYSLLRILGECFREPDLHIGYYFGFVTQGQILSLFTLALSFVLLYLKKRKILSGSKRSLACKS
ncbi:prolipoprotein diacylglyceryl transferase [Methylacidiphilum caldifontis]|uniref:Phosphatidylglycerol--prolipoprotein diacylglyceryl transferase n=2 Tax=Methylacidiphilum caldifontis TaxID=2795386 RepID=A0A4Y8PIV1_9BACT|nr:prolipoprotein diacylglyceryl transferase [Methylacidiphilum caldifontis]QSR89572.1 prolipoprotein diacylglyceryl transferase [Methylacidiphilum caldifontis]TFE71161.1 prolipoprotein diacylglyceryl transferase [Methylacidiphilum caldifontis]